jgi:mRNA interferase RelE/StbE
VNKQIDDLEFRADNVGKMLENKNSTKLAGCREIKLKDIGIRIVYRITNETVEVLQIVYILTVEKRSNDLVFKIADKRNNEFKQYKGKDLAKYLTGTPKWVDKKNPKKMKNRSNKEADK